MTPETMRRVADWVNSPKQGTIYEAMPDIFKVYFWDTCHVKPVSKERPRTGARGHTYTPERTRKFEAAVSAWAEKGMRGMATKTPVHPVAVKLWLLEPTKATATPQQALIHQRGLRYYEVGDVDNKAKAILDAVIGIVFHDDKQISSLEVYKGYAPEHGFTLSVARSGLSRAEVDEITKLVRASKNGL